MTESLSRYIFNFLRNCQIGFQIVKEGREGEKERKSEESGSINQWAAP